MLSFISPGRSGEPRTPSPAESLAPGAKPVRERTINSETRKIFSIIFGILLTVGIFTILSSARGSRTYSEVRELHLGRYRAAVELKAKALEIVAIYYALGTNQNQDLLMSHLLRYDSLVKEFNSAREVLESEVRSSASEETRKSLLTASSEVESLFERLNLNSREMTFALMEGKTEKAAPFFEKVDADIRVFKEKIDGIEALILQGFNRELESSQQLLQLTLVLGILLTLGSLALSILLIRGLNRFLSVSLLPISNMMHNLRQSVFAVDPGLRVMHPVSRYSREVFRRDVVGENLVPLLFENSTATTAEMDLARSALEFSFGEDELQWLATKSHLPARIQKLEGKGRVLKPTFTPLWNAEERLESILVVTEDVTEVEELRSLSQKKEEEIAIIQELAGAGRPAIDDFFADSHEQCSELESGEESRRAALLTVLHTLKGNAGMYRLTLLSSQIHEIESRVLATHDEEALKGEFEGLKSLLYLYAMLGYRLFGAASPWVSELMDEVGKEREFFHLSRRRIDLAVERLKEFSSHLPPELRKGAEKLQGELERLGESSLEDLKPRFLEMIRKWSVRFEKQIDFQMDCDSVSLPASRMRKLQDILGHLLRNSIDHGIETTPDRAARGKSPTGTIRLEAKEDANGILKLRFLDDGRGFDLPALARKAVSLGIVSEAEIATWNEARKIELIFKSGLSIKESANEISGRGVGLSAVRRLVQSLNGRIEAGIPPEGGAVFTLEIPKRGRPTPP